MRPRGLSMQAAFSKHFDVLFPPSHPSFPRSKCTASTVPSSSP